LPKVEQTKRRKTIKSLDGAYKYILWQGTVVNNNNLVQDEFYGLFLLAISLERSWPAASGATTVFHPHALKMWHVIQSDSAQRNLAIAAISSVPTNLNLKPALQRLEWATKTLRLLTLYRHQLAHNPIVFHAVKGEPHPEWLPVIGGQSAQPAAQSRFKMIEGITLWRQLANDLAVVAAYVRQINNGIQRLDAMVRNPTYHLQKISWPRRPRLRSWSRLREIERSLSLAGAKPARRSGRRPSRG